MKNNMKIERQLGDWMRARLPHVLTELIMFTLKMGWAALFGALLLVAMLLSNTFWQSDWPIARYDALLGFALFIQILFLVLKFESVAEAKVILLFHLTGTIMEIFKLHAGSWDYPGTGLFEIGGVPLFSGFMYASVGSFMARAIRLFNMRFAPFPPYIWTVILASLIYINFFSHHYIIDIRLALFAGTALLYMRTRIWFDIGARTYWMPLPIAAFLSSFFLWCAENIGTATKVWVYTGQVSGDWVSFAKMGSWYLLLYVSFATVTLVLRDALHSKAVTPDKR
jgi:uncharacterized membrane protein YoaT (DUF817 family)